MAVAYLARDQRLDRGVALKLLSGLTPGIWACMSQEEDPGK